MTIFNKDGKVYVLEGPNPLVKDQVKWDPSRLIYHNFNWDDVKIKNESKVKKIKTKEFEEIKRSENPTPAPKTNDKPKSIDIPKVQVEEDKVEKVEVPKSETQEQVQEPETQKTEDIKKDFDLPYIKYKVLSHCLPAIVETKNDKFYGETWTKIRYGKKIIFPSIIIDVSDFEFNFWTSDPKQQITEKSIIYPFSYEVHNTETDSYDRVPYDEYRWWKVVKKEKKEGGWLFNAVPSEEQPDFSD